jgi:glycosyltransferase involved in cell wall biosynthesis
MTINNGIDFDKFNANEDLINKRKELGFNSSDFIIGTIGRLDPVKNHERLLQAFKEALLVYKNIRLLIVGDGDQKETLCGQAKILGIYPQVKIVGFRNDVNEILSIIDIFILPSLSEGLSLALLEAMAAAKPIIASNVGGNREAIKNGHNGLLVSPLSIQEILNAILDLYNNRELGIQIGNNAYIDAKEKYSLSHMADQYMHIYLQGDANHA